MLLNSDHSCLLVIDVQEKLIPFIHEHEHVVENCRWMIQVAQKLDIPVLVSEQYPKGLGATVEELRELIPDPDDYIEKLHFSCTEDAGCLAEIQATKCSQFVLIGVETHVCVLQTALGLVDLGKEVFVVADAVGNRHPYDAEFAIARLRAAGVHIITREMALFEWAYQAGTDTFKQLSREFLR